MKIPTKLKVFCSVLMALILSNVPAVVLADEMIPTSQVVGELSRIQAENKIHDYLNRDDVRKELLSRGLAPAEVSARIASLSDTELRGLSGQIEQARAGGDILFTILIIVLIIFLIKRI